MSITNPLIQKMPPNVDGRDYVIGDIHGCFDELIKLLKHIRFDKEKDRLFSTGDLIHRGPKSEECLKLLSDRNNKGERWFFPVLGNHEDIDFQLNYGDDDIILEKLEDVLTNVNTTQYGLLVDMLIKYFENDRVAFKVNKINLGRINKKKVGWALKEIYTTITNEGLTYEYLEFIKENVLLFKDVELNKDDLFYCNLYKYFTTKV